MPNSVSIVHLSDLHFGPKSRFKDRDPVDLGRECAQSILLALAKKYPKENLDLVVVTGDIAEQAKYGEFLPALKFFISLRENLNINPSCFVFMPGNHDVSRKVCEQYSKKYPDKNLSYDQDLESIKIHLFKKFLRDFYENSPPKHIELERGAFLYDYEEFNLCIVALNSIEQVTHQQRLGTVSKEQAQKIMDTFKKMDPNKIKIISLHHAVNPNVDRVKKLLEEKKEDFENNRLGEKDYYKFINEALSVEGNEFVLEIIKNCQVNLLLHGHQHNYELPKYEPWEAEGFGQICPGGSFGIPPNCFQLYHLNKKNLKFELTSIHLKYSEDWCLPDRVNKGGFFIFENPYRGIKFEKGLEKDTFESPHIKSNIDTILKNVPDLGSALSDLLDSEDNSEKTADNLVKAGFVEVWRKVVDRLPFLLDHLEELKRILFFLSQGAIQSEKVFEMREKIKSIEPICYFKLPIRQALMAEIILKTAMEKEIDVIPIPRPGTYDAALKNTIKVPEHGIPREKLETEVQKALLNQFPPLEGYGGMTLRDYLIGCLEAESLSFQPFFFVHEYENPVEFPYLIEIIKEPKEKDVSPDSMTPVGEHTLCQLIKIILTKINELQKGRNQ